MISYLKGTIAAKTSDYIILDLGNIGYKVFISEKMQAQLSGGDKVELFCHLHMRKDETMELYGVPSFEQLRLFEMLKGISGVGPKAALLLSSLGTIKEFERAIDIQDEAFFGDVKGIGKKKIQKIILELTGKIHYLNKAKKLSKEEEETISALSSLGFTKQKAREALSLIPQDIQKTEDKVKEALRIMKSR